MERRIILNPAEQITFRSLGERQSLVLTARNNWSHAVIFKMKTTRPKVFKMRPVFGIIEPKQEKKIKLAFKGTDQPLTNRDRFTVLLAKAPKHCKDAALVWGQNTAPELHNNTVRRVIRIVCEDNTMKKPVKVTSGDKVDEGERRLKKHSAENSEENKASAENAEENKLSAERVRTPRKQSAENIIIVPPPPRRKKGKKYQDLEVTTAKCTSPYATTPATTRTAKSGRFSDDDATKTAIPGKFADDNPLTAVPAGPKENTAVCPEPATPGSPVLELHTAPGSSTSSSCSCSSPDSDDPIVIAERQREKEEAENEKEDGNEK